MAMNITHALALLLAFAMLLNPLIAFPCGPRFPTAVFTLTSRPDEPYRNFLRGNLGVIQTRYRSYDLVIAYRYLTGIGLSNDEQKALLGEPCIKESNEQEEDWAKNWLEARDGILGLSTPPEIGWHYPGGGIYRTETQNGYFSYLNCSEDAFKTAIKTLNERIQMFNKQGPEIIAWVKAQDVVFSNCSKGHNIPEPAVSGMNPIITKDRVYQIAAANFYSGDYDQAEKLFREITEDKTSPWNIIAPYLAARSLVRNATMKGGFGKVDTTLMSRAEAALQSILQDNRLSRYHKSAQDLLDYVKAKLRPEEHMHELAIAILSKDAGPRLREYLQEYRYMLTTTDGKVKKNVMATDDVTDWVLTIQNEIPYASEHAIDRWEKALSDAWLIAAISTMKAGHPKQQKLQAEANKLTPNSPGYQTAVYHSLRLLVESGHSDEARRKLDTLLNNANSGFTGSARNLLFGIRMKASANLDEFVKYSQRTPAAVGYGYDDYIEDTDDKVEQEYGGRKLLDIDSVGILNGYVPQSMLSNVATKIILTQEIKREISIAAWLRAVLLDNDQAVKNTIPLLSTLVPEMQPLLTAYGAAATKQERQFIASYIILKYPGVKPYIVPGIGRTTALDKIDNFRNNWWCSLGGERSPIRKGSGQGSHNLLASGTGYPEFMTKEDIEETEREIGLMLKIDAAPNYIGAIILPWADKKPSDPRVPEALHLFVKATRYGCSDKQTSNYSKEAFMLLHKRYSDNKWTKETPYYY